MAPISEALHMGAAGMYLCIQRSIFLLTVQPLFRLDFGAILARNGKKGSSIQQRLKFEF